MNLEIVIVFLVLALNLVLGLVVFLKGPQKKINQLFAATVFSIIIWISAYFLENWGLNEPTSKFFLKMDFAFAGIVSYFWLIFCINFPSDSQPKSTFYALYLVIVPLIFAIMSFTNLIVTNFRVINEVIMFDRGFLYFLYVLFIFSYMFGGCLVLFYRYKKVDKVVQRQVIYILIGALLTLLGVLFITLILPQISEISLNIARLGIYSILFLVGFTAYAITKHHLFDIRVILTETAVAIVVSAMFIQTLLSKSLSMGVINGGILLLVAYGGYLLIKSIQEEIRRREELKRLSDQLTVANAHLKELDRMKTEFVSLASHELLTPVSAIEGYLSMLLDEKLAKIEDPKAVRYMDRVYTSAKRLARLVTDMLNVSRIEEGRLLVEKKEIDLSDLINQVIDEIKFKAEEKKQKIIFADGSQTTDYSGSKKAVDGSRSEVSNFMTFGDQDKLKEIFINLIGNSIKYSKDPGTITISITREPTSEVAEKWQKVEDEIKARPLDDQEAIKSAVDSHLRDLVGKEQLLISVKDQGIGIPKEELPRLFKKFHRVGDYTTAESQGTGLGLYISRALVELHHGRIWADSEGPSHGSTFTFSLPDISSKDELIQMEAQAPQPKEQLKPLARPVKEAEEL